MDNRIDYKKLGLRVGLEIHQQLNSGHKLFCNCPIISTAERSEEFPVKIKRKQRPVAGELGEFDPAALYEFLRDREFNYNINFDSSCLVESDEEPPHNMNFAALYTVLQVCKLMKSTIVDEIHVMRKTVVDGSAVSGFQRTSLVGMSGEINTSFGKVPVQTICVEEDAAPPIKKENMVVDYRLDRLGIPLIEIATDPAMSTPEEAKETAEKIGMLLRSTGAVVRGIGSIRQDVNVSIREGARVEIKGFQELDKMPQLIENEVVRQKTLLDIKKELIKRGYKELDKKYLDVTKVFKDTECNFLKKIIDKKGKIYAVVLDKFSGLLKKELGDRTFGKELNSYAQAHGYGIIHSDEKIDKYHLTDEFIELQKQLNVDEQDAIVISAGKDPEKAVFSIIDRANHCIKGIPVETRVADGLGSKYTRPLPGSERMYPESDIPTEILDKKLIDSIQIPKTLEEREKQLQKIMSKEMAHQLISSRLYELYEKLSEKYAKQVILIANTLLSTLKDLKRKGFDVDKLNESHLDYIFENIDNGKIGKKSIPNIIERVMSDENITEVINDYMLISGKELESIIKSIIKEKPDLNDSAMMGIIMKKVKGRAEGSKIIEILKKLNK
ncbi:Glu-tRNA(Gln) amidotransferase subunit GatE [Candidatus Aenigmatarchaeota archaeon]